MVVGRTIRITIATAVVAGGLALSAQAASAATSFHWFKGYDEASTPKKLDKVGVLRIGPRKANKILILNPGTSAASAYFRPLARTIVKKTRGWQIWSIERRGSQLEDQSVFDQVKLGEASVEDAFHYYLEWLTDPSITDHFEFIPDEDVAFGREWGMKVAVKDLRRVVRRANRKADTVVMGGHSLGGSITTAYATWDFNGEPGARGLDGLVFIDGGSGPDPSLTPAEASDRLDELAMDSPWLTFGGIPSPLTGLFNSVGAEATLTAPDEPSLLGDWPCCRPISRRRSTSPTRRATATRSTPTPRLRASRPRRSTPAGSRTPAIPAVGSGPARSARCGGWQGSSRAPELQGLDGTGWYHPTRLNLDSGGVAAGNDNPTQDVLDLDATHGDDLGKMPIYAFGAALGGQRVLDAASALAKQSSIPKRKLRLVNRESTYTHIDPLSAHPKNAFLRNLLKFLRTQVR